MCKIIIIHFIIIQIILLTIPFALMKKQDMPAYLKVTYRSSPNIAWVKYWGKYNQQNILPINDSLGVTLNTEDIFTQTTVKFSKQFTEDTIFLNQGFHPVSKRMEKMFTLIKSRAYDNKYNKLCSLEEFNQYHFNITSANSFPTASGMASSASGLACLAVALNGLFDNVLNPQELSELARMGSGSACRSIYGGLVRWKGVPAQILNNKNQANKQQLQKLSKQCISNTVVPAENLSKIRVLILLANNKQKQVSSTSGMAHSVKTSQLIQYRNGIATRRIDQILSGLNKFEAAKQTEQGVGIWNSIMQNIMKDSNQFHAICLDTYPPIFYLNQFSKQIIYFVDNILNPALKYKIAYTFDAGPHAFLFLHQSAQLILLQYFKNIFQLNLESFNTNAQKKLNKIEDIGKSQIIFKEYHGQIYKPYQIWSTSVGRGTYKIQ